MLYTYNLSDVFISYARADEEFVRQLNRQLQADGHSTWVDWQDIPESTQWWQEIKVGIESTNTFVFIISPASVASQVCYDEISHAVANNKRLIPVVKQELSKSELTQLHQELSRHNWLFFRDEDNFETVFEKLLNTMNTDLDYVRAHTRYQLRALDWDIRNRNTSALLAGREVGIAEEWLQDSAVKKPQSTDLQREFIERSIKRVQGESRRQEIVHILIPYLRILLAALGAAVGSGLYFFTASNFAYSSNFEFTTQSLLLVMVVWAGSMALIRLLADQLIARFVRERRSIFVANLISAFVVGIILWHFTVGMLLYDYGRSTINLWTVGIGAFALALPIATLSIKKWRGLLASSLVFTSLSAGISITYLLGSNVIFYSSGRSSSILLDLDMWVTENHVFNIGLIFVMFALPIALGYNAQANWDELRALIRLIIGAEQGNSSDKEIILGKVYAPIVNVSDVFISYSRRNIDMIRKIVDELDQSGKHVWIDWEEIPESADWWEEIKAGIEGADIFVFVISPDSAQSPVCGREIEHAVKYNKRIVPVLYAELDESLTLPDAIQNPQWVFLSESTDFTTGMTTLKRTLDADLEYTRNHTRWLIRAREWEAGQHDQSYLLGKVEAKEAYKWLQQNEDKEPQITKLQDNFIRTSYAPIKQRSMLVVTGFHFSITAVFGFVAFIIYLLTTHRRYNLELFIPVSAPLFGIMYAFGVVMIQRIILQQSRFKERLSLIILGFGLIWGLVFWLFFGNFYTPDLSHPVSIIIGTLTLYAGVVLGVQFRLPGLLRLVLTAGFIFLSLVLSLYFLDIIPGMNTLFPDPDTFRPLLSFREFEEDFEAYRMASVWTIGVVISLLLATGTHLPDIFQDIRRMLS